MPRPDEDPTAIAAIAGAIIEIGAERGSDLSGWIREAQADLRRLARSERVQAGAGETLSTTALVNEVYLRFAQRGSRFVDRKHFFATAARAMRQILVDYARARFAQKRGGHAPHEPLDSVEHAPAPEAFGVDLLVFDQALDALERALPRPAQVVHLRFFAGLDDREIGALLGIEESTVRRDWLKARGWLHLYLSGDPV